MKSIRVGSWFALGFAMLAALPAAAAEKPINLSIFTPISLAKAEDAVTAFRFNLIYGRNTSVKIVDLGFINHTTSGVSNGLEWGLANFAEGTFSGLQLGALNFDKGTGKGLLLGGVNYTMNGGGIHVAFVNYAEKLQGVQIGAVNIIKQGGMFPVMVIANWSKKQ